MSVVVNKCSVKKKKIKYKSVFGENFIYTTTDS